MEPRISVVINTLNEEKNLPYALRSVRPWVDEIVVVDMYSQDRTADIVLQFKAKLYYHERMNFADPARAFAVSQATGEWILVLDADEVIPLPLSCKLREIARGDVADVVKLHRLNYLLGVPLGYSGWGPSQDALMRFFKRGWLHMTARIHDFLKPVPGARILEIPYQPDHAIVHFPYLDVAQFLERLNRYTTIEAEQARERGETTARLSALAHAAREFIGRYVRARGYRDGWRGLYLSLFMAFYRLATYAKVTELESLGRRAAVEAIYQREAERILREYEDKTSDLFSA